MVIALNKKGIKPDKLEVLDDQEPVKKDFEDVVGQDSLTRFDKSKKRSGNNGGNGRIAVERNRVLRGITETRLPER